MPKGSRGFDNSTNAWTARSRFTERRATNRFGVCVAAGALAFLAFCLWAGPAVGATRSSNTGTLLVQVAGLPPQQAGVIRIVGGGTTKLVQTRDMRLALAAGQYTLEPSPVRVASAWHDVLAGARAFPASAIVRVTVRPGGVARGSIVYSTIVNPGVRRLSPGLIGVVGLPSTPSGLVYRGSAAVAGPGAIITAGPTSLLPDGLVARVTAKQIVGDRIILSVRPVPITAVVPEFRFSGVTRLRPVRHSPFVLKAGSLASTALAADSASCKSNPFDFGASLDQFQIRQASASIWPPRITLQLAARTTEHFGVSAGSDISCDWNLATLGPWDVGVIPTPFVDIPVYIEIPVTASADLSGSLASVGLNVASTHVLTVVLGSGSDFNFQEQGANVWLDHSFSGTGSANFSVGAAFQFGIGDPKLGDLHVDVGFSTTASLSSQAATSTSTWAR